MRRKNDTPTQLLIAAIQATLVVMLVVFVVMVLSLVLV